MARLILKLTKEEKNAPSFLDWDNESIGKACKKMAWAFEQEMDFEKYRSIAGFGAMLLLVSYAHEANAAELNLTVKGITLKDGKPLGDWLITVKKEDGKLF